MRVHYHIPVGFVGGAERQLQYLIKYAKRLDPAYSPSITYESTALTPFVQALDVPATRVLDKKSLLNALNTRPVDVLQFYTSPLVYRALPYLNHKPAVIEVIHNKNQFQGDATSYGKEYTSVAVCVSPDAEEFIRQHVNVRTMVIPNGVDQDQFYPAPGMRSPTPVVGFAGRLCHDKGVGILLKLAPKMPCLLELVGQDFMGLRDLPPNVAVFPQTDQVDKFYRRWWAFVSASPHESFGLAIAEAMACGTPPVMLDCGGITAYLEDRKHGYIGDTEEWLVEAIRYATEGQLEEDHIDPLSVDFSAEVMASGYLDVYRGNIAPAAVKPSPPRKIRKMMPPLPQTPRIFHPVVCRPRVEGGSLGITPAGWYGVVRALAGCCDWFAEPQDAKKAIDTFNPKVIVLGCFQGDWRQICVYAQRRGIKVVATWHASYILNEFDNINRKWMGELLDAKKEGIVDYLATPHEGLAKSWTYYGYQAAFFPNVIDEELKPVPKLPGGPHIGILGSGQTWKNMECQIVAAGMVSGATIHVQEVRNREVIDRLGIKVVTHPKTLTDSEYYALLGGMHVNMCVSLSEVYSYLIAESFMMETPVLTTHISPLVQELSIFKGLCTGFFENPYYLAERLETILDDTWVGLRAHMLKVNAANRAICAKVIEGWK